MKTRRVRRLFAALFSLVLVSAAPVVAFAATSALNLQTSAASAMSSVLGMIPPQLDLAKLAPLNLPAKPFVLDASSPDYAGALHCLTDAVYFEAGRQSDDGKAAVAQTVLNRVRHPNYPKSVCGVVFEGSKLRTGCQFSFTCDGSMRRQAIVPAVWSQAEQVAKRALSGYVMTAVGEATYYHADYVHPYWAPALAKIVQIGAHIFYRWPGAGGDPSAFTGEYAGGEAALTPAVLRGTDMRLAGLKPAVFHSFVRHVRLIRVSDRHGHSHRRVHGEIAMADTVMRQ